MNLTGQNLTLTLSVIRQDDWENGNELICVFALICDKIKRITGDGLCAVSQDM